MYVTRIISISIAFLELYVKVTTEICYTFLSTTDLDSRLGTIIYVQLNIFRLSIRIEMKQIMTFRFGQLTVILYEY